MDCGIIVALHLSFAFVPIFLSVAIAIVVVVRCVGVADSARFPHHQLFCVARLQDGSDHQNGDRRTTRATPAPGTPALLYCPDPVRRDKNFLASGENSVAAH